MVKAYIGIGQNICINDGEALIAQEILKVISGKEREKYLEVISDKDSITFGNENFDDKKFATHRSISGRYLMKDVIAQAQLAKITLLSPYYSLSEVRWYLMSSLELQKLLLDELGSLDLRERSTEFKVPMIFISGDKDWVTLYPMVEDYYNLIEAPYKEVIFIENAGHSPMLDNPEMFSEEVLKVLEELQ